MGEPAAFFESSSELASSLAERKGSPRDRRRDALVDVPVSRSLPRDPYLFFKYRAQELKAAPSFSPPVGTRSGELSLDFNACEERLRDNSEPPVPEPYRAARYADGDAVVGDTGSSASSSSPAPKPVWLLLLRARRLRRSFRARYLDLAVGYLESSSNEDVASSSRGLLP